MKSDIHVQVVDGTVTLRGKASSFEERSTVCNAAWSAPGARRVINKPSVGRSTSSRFVSTVGV